MALEDWKDFVSASATISTILQFFSGLQVCYGFIKKGTTGDASVLPFLAGAVNCSVWLKYGLIIEDPAMIVVNLCGTTLLLLSTLIFLNYTIKRHSVLRSMLSAIIFLVMLHSYLFSLSDDESRVRKTLGIVGSVGSVIFCAAPLATLSLVFRSRSTDSMPFVMILATFLVTGQWWLYGVILQDNYIQWPNCIGCILAAFQLSLFAYFPSAGHKSPRYENSIL